MSTTLSEPLETAGHQPGDPRQPAHTPGTTAASAAAPAPEPAAATTEDAAARRDALAGRLFGATLGTMDLLTIYVGDRLGLYRALKDGGPATSAELAHRTGTHERYAREWLEQQATTGILEVSQPSEDALLRRYLLPSGHDEVLLDQDSLSYMGALGRAAVALGTMAPSVTEAFRTGGGVSWAQFGHEIIEAQGALNRPVFLHLLGKQWLPAIPDLHQRLGQPGARVADVACGHGWSSIAIALAYPHARVDGFDLDESSITAARRHAQELGVADRVTFHLQDAGSPDLPGGYTLAIICEALHDLSQPVQALQAMRRLTAGGGTVLVMDEKTAESFGQIGDELERFFYGWSVLCCLPCCMSQQPSAATGTAMRPHTLRRYAAEAGFRSVEILPIQHDLFRLYRLED